MNVDDPKQVSEYRRFLDDFVTSETNKSLIQTYVPGISDKDLEDAKPHEVEALAGHIREFRDGLRQAYERAKHPELAKPPEEEVPPTDPIARWNFYLKKHGK